MNVLLTCVGRRKYLVDYFKAEAGVSLVVGADMQIDAPAFYSCDVCRIVPSIYDEDYILKIIDICKELDIDMIVSLNDMELPILSSNRELFEELGVCLVVSNDNVIDICSDKWLTYNFAVEHNLNSPATYLSAKDAISDINFGSLSYPLIVKPRWGSASFGLYKVYDDDELLKCFEQCQVNIANSYLKDFCKSMDSVIIQEFMPGQEFGVDIFNSFDCEYISSTQKKKLSMRSGETDKATTMKDIGLVEISKKISAHLGHIGNLDCDFFLSGDQYYLLEMNPRFGGGYPFSHEAGSNYVKNLIELASCKEISISSYKLNVTFSKCDVLVPSIGN